jgi:hypothetical protein
VRANRVRRALAIAVLAALPRAAAPQAAPQAATRVVAGELVSVNVSRGTLTVKIAGTPPREIDVRVDPGTAISSRGRPLRLVDLRPGERLTAACADDAAGEPHAQRIKLGGKAR